MTFLQMFFVYLCVFLVSRFGIKQLLSVSNGQSDKQADLTAWTGMVLFGAIFIGAAFFALVMPGTPVFLYFSLLAIGLLVFVGAALNMAAFKKTIGLAAICFIGSYLMYDMPLFPAGFGGVVVHLALAILWAILIWVYVKMDRVPFLSMTLSCGFAVFYFLIATVFQIMPAVFGYFAIAVLIAHMGAMMALKSQSILRLGMPAATLFGFLWAAMGIYLISLGHALPVGVIYAYPVMEIIFSSIITFGIYRKLSLTYPFLVEQALSKNIFPGKVLQSVLMWEILIAAVAALSVLEMSITGYAYCTIVAVILVNAYIRLTSWGEAKPKLRDVVKDLKAGLIQAKKEWEKLPLKPKKEVELQHLQKPTDIQKSVSEQPAMKTKKRKGRVSSKKTKK